MAQLLNILFVFLILHRLTHLSALLHHIKSLSSVSPCCLPVPVCCRLPVCRTPAPLPPPPHLFDTLPHSPVPACYCFSPLHSVPIPVLPCTHSCLTQLTQPLSVTPPLSLTYSLPPPHPSPYPLLPHPTRRYAPTGGLNARIHKRIVELGEPAKG